MTIPNELINKILSFREKHSIRKILVCVHCGEEEYFNDYLYIYHRIRSWSSNNNGRWTNIKDEEEDEVHKLYFFFI